MAFQIGATLLDAMVLSIVEKEDTYGYKITAEIRDAMEMSESTLYPVLRRLQKDECLEAYDMEFMGRNRRYYRVTSRGNSQLNLYKQEWQTYKQKIDGIMSPVTKKEME